MMKRDKVVFENEKFEVTGYDIWMTAGEIASLFGVTIMKVRSIINRMRKQLTVNLDFRHWICDRTTNRKERAMIVYF